VDQNLFRSKQVSATTINEWLSSHGCDSRYGAEAHKVLSEKWLQEVDAPKLLSDMFGELSEQTERFHKPLTSVQLTKAILTRDPSVLQELTDYVLNVCPNRGD
jgi:hypothetical protein